MSELELALELTGEEWTLETAEGRPMTVNKYRTLSKFPRAQFDRRVRRAWRDLAGEHDLPALTAAVFVVTPLHINRRSPQDPAACVPEAKAAVDGLVDAGVLVDDDGTRVLEVRFRPPDVCGRDGLRITVAAAVPRLIPTTPEAPL